MSSKTTNPDDTPPAAPAVAPLPPAEPEVTNAVSHSDDGRRAYEVTDRAPPKVAGRRVKAKDELLLTEEEARAEILAGAIVPKGKKLPKPMQKRGKTV
tara:strand:- start:7809 stop:8102 length:294 start_codon:yes stop_codon:yes gene_type:complete